MATLVLGTVGSIVAGPIGGAIGAVLGNQLDRAVLAPKGRRGPRLGDLSVQTSSYGSPLPRLFGTMRVAGTVIWATDLREDTHHSGGGKGSAATTSYSYSASFAVALSARSIQSIGRIWADGNLLRGAAGDWKTQTGFRLYLGNENQQPDPLIASAEGIDATPAHRGIAYCVFEALQLGDFGNRIPMLTFEVTAEPAPVAVAAIAGELSDGAIEGPDEGALDGYAASGDSVRGALETLAAAYPMHLSDDGDVLRLNDTSCTSIDETLLGAGAETGAAHIRQRQPAAALADAVAVQYYEPARDYQAGLQRARRDGIGRHEDKIELPVALGAEAARGLAEQALSRIWLERERATVTLPWRCLDIRCGSQVALAGDGLWRVGGWSLEQMTLSLSLTRATAMPAVAGPADPGRATTAADLIAGATRVELLDLPTLDDTLADAPNIWVAAAGTESGWRRAELSLSLDDGASWRSVGVTALPAVIGHAEEAIGSSSPHLFDRQSAALVTLLNDAMVLQGADEAALIAGGNLALLGDELIQFAQVQMVGTNSYRLTELLRGRRGSEWAIGHHSAGERFVLLDAATLKPLAVPAAMLGSSLQISALGPGDEGTPAHAAADVVGASLRPPAPVDLRAQRASDGTIRFTWTRRSRDGWLWLDGGDVPLGEDAERYRVQISPAIGSDRIVEVSEPAFLYDPAMQIADGAAAAQRFTLTVTQLGTRGASLPPATAIIDG